MVERPRRLRLLKRLSLTLGALGGVTVFGVSLFSLNLSFGRSAPPSPPFVSTPMSPTPPPTAPLVPSTTPAITSATEQVFPDVAVTLRAPRFVDAERPFDVKWSAKNMPPGAAIVVERQLGTADSWRTVAHLGAAHTATVPGLPMGRHRVRITVVGGGRTLGESEATVFSFGRVPLATLTSQWWSVLARPGVYTTPARTFSYAFRFYLPWQHNPVLAVDRTQTCKSVHIDWIPGSSDNNPQPESRVMLTLVQESADPVPRSAAYDEFASLDATLVPGESWSISMRQIGGAAADDAFVNGYAVCYSSEPWPL